MDFSAMAHAGHVWLRAGMLDQRMGIAKMEGNGVRKSIKHQASSFNEMPKS
jgi:hypothetical protein